MAISIQTGTRTGKRITRFPQHRWYIESRPYSIQPICIAPVLPGETLKRATVQSRVVSDPIANPLVGWWHEYYFFYVKLRDLAGRDDFTDMLTDVDKSLSAYHEAADPKYYHKSATQVPWLKLCTQRIVEEYFRDEGETWDTQHYLNVPKAQIMQKSWLDSTINDANYLSEDETVPHTTGTPDTAEASDVEEAMNKWQFMRSVGMTEMSYEDFLKTFGVNIHQEEPHKPELLRYIRKWTYPTNTIDPTDGSPTSALSWSFKETIDKDRFFKEHGFVVGLSLTRPKIFFGNQNASATEIMDSPFAWLPALMQDSPHTSLIKVTAGQPPVTGITDDYWIDIRDLFLYGDQMYNYTPAAYGEFNNVGVPLATLEKRYCSDADIQFLFAGANYDVREDGVISLAILGTQVDHTPTQTG